MTNDMLIAEVTKRWISKWMRVSAMSTKEAIDGALRDFASREKDAAPDAAGDAELIRLLNQRYQDLGDTTARKAADRLAALARLTADAKPVFTPNEVAYLWEFQKSGAMHPFTCPHRGENHIENGIDLGGLIPTVHGWICQCCDYKQDWAHDFMLNGNAVKSHKEMWDNIAKDRPAAHPAEATEEMMLVPREPTKEMLNAARDWSIKKYGRGIGNDSAIGCWNVMYQAWLSAKGAP